MTDSALLWTWSYWSSRPGLLKVRTPVRIRTGREFNPDPLDISSALVSLRAPCGARGTHTHTHRRMNQCCSDYRLFCKTKHIATSEILDKPLISFSRIMSPVSPREHEISPSWRRFLHRQSYQRIQRTEPNRSRLLNERVQNSASKNLLLLTVWHINMNVVLL